MMFYALGALELFDCLYDIHTVRLSICQPRLENIYTYEASVEELLDWAENILKPAAQLAWNGEGEFCSSKYTCKFCKAKATCRARAEKNLEIAKFEFKQAALLSKEEILGVLARADEIAAWCKDVWSWAEAKAIVSEEFESFKVVERRSVRTYGYEGAAVAKLTEEGYSENAIFSKSLKGIACGLGNLQKLADGEPLSGRSRAENST